MCYVILGHKSNYILGLKNNCSLGLKYVIILRVKCDFIIFELKCIVIILRLKCNVFVMAQTCLQLISLPSINCYIPLYYGGAKLSYVPHCTLQ